MIYVWFYSRGTKHLKNNSTSLESILTTPKVEPNNHCRNKNKAKTLKSDKSCVFFCSTSKGTKIIFEEAKGTKIDSACLVAFH